MSDLMELLLENNDRATGKALRAYDKAVRKLKKRQLKFKGCPMVFGADEVAEILEKRLNRQLEKIDLSDNDQYQKAKLAIESWQPSIYPQDMASLQSCGLIQNILLSLLPQCRKKQQLVKICERYQTHLQAEIDKEKAACSFPDNGKTSPKTLISDVTVESKQRISLPESLPSDPSFSLEMAIKKQAAVTELQKSLQTRKPVYMQLQDFDQAFSKHQPLIEKNRDSAAMTFLKGIATLLSGGLAIVLGIWRSKGDGATEEIKKVLSPTPQSTVGD